MQKLLFPCVAVLLLLAACKKHASKTGMTQKTINVSYPKTDTVSVQDEYFGTIVKDPYRWLEHPDTPQTVEWVKAQNAVTFGYLDSIPFRGAINKRLKEIWDFEKYGAPFKEGGKYYFYKNNGVQNQSVLYVQDALNAEPKVCLDPNSFSKDGTVSLAQVSFNKTGSIMAYSIQDGGSDWNDIYVIDPATGKKTEDLVRWAKFSGIAWHKDGFYYSRYRAGDDKTKLSKKNENHEVYYHKLGTPQDKDELVFNDKAHPQRNHYAGTTEDERYLILSISESTSGNAWSFKNIEKGDKAFTPVVTTFDHDFSVVDNIGDKFLVLTNHKAPKYRLIEVDAANPKEENWKEIIPEAKEVLEGVSVVGGKLVCTYIKDVASLIKINALDGKPIREVQLPGIGTVGGFSGKKDDKQAFFTFASFTRPTTIYSYDMETGQQEVFKESKVKFDLTAYETKQVFYPSKDGTKIPMFITHKKGLKMDGSNPTLLYGYGGFNISVQPSFSISNMILLENGGVYAIANIRGGGEYGEEWHKAGTKMNKQNVFNDFIAAAEYLVAEKYTAPKKIAIEGRSNGGLLVGACMTQRPDLFGVALPGVGVLDMLRYHLFTIGWAWATDYGRSDESKEMFEYLYKYSPVHNCKPADYPATMVTTADHDDRVVPAHSYKFIAALQAAQKGKAPVLIRIDTRAGHGAGKPTEMVIQENTDRLAFLLYNLGANVNYN